MGLWPNSYIYIYSWAYHPHNMNVHICCNLVGLLERESLTSKHVVRLIYCLLIGLLFVVICIFLVQSWMLARRMRLLFLLNNILKLTAHFYTHFVIIVLCEILLLVVCHYHINLIFFSSLLIVCHEKWLWQVCGTSIIIFLVIRKKNY